MRLLTWNCCRGAFERKVPLLDSYAYDVAVIQECCRPERSDDSVLWFGENPQQGIAICAGPGYRLSPLIVDVDLLRYVIPIQVTGPRSFLLLAVWTQRQPTYVEPVFHAAEVLNNQIRSQSTVILGDFNSNAQWDRKRKSARDHSALVNYLAELNLVSAYHHWSGEEHGRESQPTFFFRWQQDSPFHIDYCFIPREWAENVQRVHVGDYAGWAAISDHRPMLVDIA